MADPACAVSWDAHVALTKALAYKSLGNQVEAERWTREVVRLIGCTEILSMPAPWFVIPVSPGLTDTED